MNRDVLQVAKRFVDGNNLQEGMLNRVEAVIHFWLVTSSDIPALPDSTRHRCLTEKQRSAP